MIVVEGPDGAGKSTLCSIISKEYELKVGERATANRDEIWRTTREDTWRAMYEELRCDEPSLVWDRIGPFSDPIYARHGVPHRRESSFTPNERRAFRVMFNEGIALLIVCLPPLKVIINNVDKSHQLEGVGGRIESIYSDYWDLQHMGSAVRYDYTTGNLPLFAVGQYLELRKERECFSSSTMPSSE